MYSFIFIHILQLNPHKWTLHSRAFFLCIPGIFPSGWPELAIPVIVSTKMIALWTSHKQCSKPLLVDDYSGMILPNTLEIIYNNPIEGSRIQPTRIQRNESSGFCFHCSHDLPMGISRLVFSLHGPSSAISKFFSGVNSPSGENSHCLTKTMEAKHGPRGVETRPVRWWPPSFWEDQ